MVQPDWPGRQVDDRSSAHEITVSDVGLMTAARVTTRDPEAGEPFIAVQCTRTGTGRTTRSALLSALPPT